MPQYTTLVSHSKSVATGDGDAANRPDDGTYIGVAVGERHTEGETDLAAAVHAERTRVGSHRRA